MAVRDAGRAALRCSSRTPLPGAPQASPRSEPTAHQRRSGSDTAQKQRCETRFTARKTARSLSSTNAGRKMEGSAAGTKDRRGLFPRTKVRPRAAQGQPCAVGAALWRSPRATPRPSENAHRAAVREPTAPSLGLAVTRRQGAALRTRPFDTNNLKVVVAKASPPRFSRHDSVLATGSHTAVYRGSSSVRGPQM